MTYQAILTPASHRFPCWVACVGSKGRGRDGYMCGLPETCPRPWLLSQAARRPPLDPTCMDHSCTSCVPTLHPSRKAFSNTDVHCLSQAARRAALDPTFTFCQSFTLSTLHGLLELRQTLLSSTGCNKIALDPTWMAANDANLAAQSEAVEAFMVYGKAANSKTVAVT